MNNSESPFLAMKRLQMQITDVLRGFDIFGHDEAYRGVVKALKRDLADARLDIRDYELSETREEQLKNAKLAKQTLTTIRKEILTASEYNVFTPVEVAQFSAQLEQIIENVR